MKLMKGLQICLKAGILLAVFGLTISEAKRGGNKTTQIGTSRHHNKKENIIVMHDSVVQDKKEFLTLPSNTTRYDENPPIRSEQFRETRVVPDTDVSTTQKYENSKLLFSYVVPVESSSTEPPKMEKKESTDEKKNVVYDNEDVKEEDNEEDDNDNKDDGEDDNEDGDDDSEEEESEHENVKEEDGEEEEEEEDDDDHDDPKGQNSERIDEEEYEKDDDEKHYEADEDRQEYEEEEIKPAQRRKDFVGQEEEMEDSEEEHYENEAEQEEESQGLTEEEERSTEKGRTREPVNLWQQNHPQLQRNRHFEFTTIQPFGEPRPVSYSSVVYDPDGKSKTELSGSFYKKPLKVSPNSGVFPSSQENVSENTKTVTVTCPPVAEERSIQAPLEEEEDEEEEDFQEPEAVTSNINYNIQENGPVMPKRIMNLKPLRARYNFNWREEQPEKEIRDPGAYYELPEKDIDDETKPKTYNEKKSQQFHDKSNRENYYEQTINTRFGSKEKGISEEGESYESEVGDLMKPQAEEEWKHETIQSNVVSDDDDDDDDGRDSEEITTLLQNPVKKDRNQLYEYLIADGKFRHIISQNRDAQQGHTSTEGYDKDKPEEKKIEQQYLPTTTEEQITQIESENKEPQPKYAPTTPDNTVTSTEAQPVHSTPKEENTEKPQGRYAKPQKYSFGTITKPKSDKFKAFQDDVIYNQIVSNIQSLFTPTTPKPTQTYEQHFLPSHSNCQRHHDSLNYESFIKPSQTRPYNEEEEDEEEEDDEEDNSMPKRLPMKTYIVQKPRIIHKVAYPMKKPSGIKMTVQPMTYREAKPVMYRNAVYVTPVANQNNLIRKVVYYTPNESQKRIMRYSPTNRILRIVRPQIARDNLVVPSGRMLIIRKL